MNYDYDIHPIGGHILQLSDKPDKNISNGIRYRVEKVIVHGAFQHYEIGQWIYTKPKDYKSVIKALFELYKIDGIR